ncbi:MAG: DUF362 domain-containing protein [Candidatus Omnitrophota bacterium]|nr:MAG: DUF362 domain-containing protein [Candidatus Omnitrophota bacterium]
MSDKTLNTNFRVSLLRCQSAKQIRQKLYAALVSFSDIFPTSKDAHILIKPNLNSNMNALTGNTTDLRLLDALLSYLRDQGYGAITIGEGTSSGFHREKINIFTRLCIDKLARRFNAKLLDLNYAPYEYVEFEHGEKAAVARICKEADFFINLPKLKTHFEALLSVCLKNMMGALVGLPNKQKTHRSLFKNILNLNKFVKPHLHIIDGLIAMEGTGPSSGTPIKTDVVLIGTDPYLLDLACAKIAGFDYKEIPYLRLAEERGIINQDYLNFVEAFIPKEVIRIFKRPHVNSLVRFVNHPNWQYSFIKIRLSPLVNKLFSFKSFGRLLNAAGLRQDVFDKQDLCLKDIYFEASLCDNCKKCQAYCPVGLVLPEQLHPLHEQCIGCLYCFLVCPKKAIKIKGTLGFFKEQLKRYDNITRSIA